MQAAVKIIKSSLIGRLNCAFANGSLPEPLGTSRANQSKRDEGKRSLRSMGALT